MKAKSENRRLDFLTAHLTVEILPTLRQVEEIKNEWQDLFDSCTNPCVFQAFNWNYTCLKHFHKNGKSAAAVVTVREKGNLVGIGPFVVEYRLGLPQIEPIGNKQYAYFSLLLADGREDAAEAIAAKLVESYPQSVIHIPYYGAGDYGIAIFVATLLSLGWNESRWTRNISHYIYENKGFDNYLAKKSAKTRQTLKRKLKKLQKSGKMEVHHFTRSNLKPSVVDRIADIQRKSWLARRGIEVLDSPFHKELITLLGETGNAEVYILSLDGNDIAFILNFCSGPNHYLMFTGFEESQFNLKPGENLMGLSLNNIFDRNNKTYDFLFGDAVYKKFWGNRTKLVCRGVCYKGIRGWLLSWVPHRLHGFFSNFTALKSLLDKLRQVKRTVFA